MFAALIAASITLPVALAGGSAEDAVVSRVRAAWKTAEARVQAGELSSSDIQLGGGQNASSILVHYLGGTEADFEADPYAEPFTVLRVEQRKVLPAVGPVSATFWYEPSGELFFVHAAGTDISGVTDLSLSPMDELRVYFDAGTPVLLLHDDATSDPPRKSYPLRGAAAARSPAAAQAAHALQVRGEALRRSLETLAKAP